MRKPRRSIQPAPRQELNQDDSEELAGACYDPRASRFRLLLRGPRSSPEIKIQRIAPRLVAIDRVAFRGETSTMTAGLIASRQFACEANRVGVVGLLQRLLDPIVCEQSPLLV